jgi:shikimate kinase
VPPSSRCRAILLTGTVGSGKTAVTLEIGQMLDGRDQPYALIDLDWLAWLRPAPGTPMTVDEVLAENLRAVWRTFRRAGVERLVLARCLERAAQIDALRRALPGVEIFVVRLVAPLPVLEARLRRRDTSAELAEHLSAAASAGRAEVAELADAVVDSGDRTARDVAQEVLAVAGWTRR